MVQPLLIALALGYLLAVDIRELFTTPKDALRPVLVFAGAALVGVATTWFLPGAAGLASLVGGGLAAVEMSRASTHRRSVAEAEIARSGSTAETILWLDGRIDAVRGKRGLLRLSITIAVWIILLTISLGLSFAASLGLSPRLALVALFVALVPILQASRFLLDRDELLYLKERRAPFLVRK